MVELAGTRRLRPRRPRLDTAAVATGIAAAAIVTWLVTLQQMDGMDAGPGTDLGGIAWFTGAWVTMMAAMMLPSALPMVLVYSKVSRDRERHGGAYAPTWVFAGGYMLVWAAFGLVAYGIQQGVVALDPAFLRWDRQGPIAAGVVIALAGVYEATPLKDACLRYCRTPMAFVMGGFRKGVPGALRMGVEHGLWCVACCWGIMVALFALGVMSVQWMAVMAAVVFVEKLLPRGRMVTRVIALLLIALGIWVAVAPGSVPGLVEPGTRPAMDMGGMEMSGGGAPAPAATTTAPADDMAGMDMAGMDRSGG